MIHIAGVVGLKFRISPKGFKVGYRFFIHITLARLSNFNRPLKPTSECGSRQIGAPNISTAEFSGAAKYPCFCVEPCTATVKRN